MADAGGIPTITSSPKETSETTNIDFGATFCGGYRSLFTCQFPTPKIDSNILHLFLFVYGVIRIQGDRCDKACYQNGIGSNKSKGCHFSLPAVEEVLRKCDGELVCKERSSSPAVALFRAFRQLYEEAAPVLYSRNMFFFNQCRHECQVVVPNNDIYTSALPGAVVFLKRLSPDVKDRIKKIKIVLGLYNSGLWRDFASREETMNFWKRRVVFQRSKERLLVARCNGDDDTGQSYLTPAERLSPPFRGSHQESILLSFLTIRGLLYPFPSPLTYDEFRKQTLRVTFPYGEPPFLPLSFIPNDYKDDDDGENDSLNEVDVSSEPDIFSLPKVQELLTTCKTVAQVTSASSWSISNETVNYVEADNDEEDEDDEDEDEQEEEDDDDDDDEDYEGV
ncbi:hypothetical protein IWZ03DRAFT_355742 [Phyllosticta citriasiana]|uniref:SUEL-type lectin domain-containing protein n=1 Tax=Phyllosticta citriasiana TaxID=595635 RepID=A0ABR1KYS8_9PEZI